MQREVIAPPGRAQPHCLLTSIWFRKEQSYALELGHVSSLSSLWGCCSVLAPISDTVSDPCSDPAKREVSSDSPCPQPFADVLKTGHRHLGDFCLGIFLRIDSGRREGLVSHI